MSVHLVGSTPAVTVSDLLVEFLGDLGLYMCSNPDSGHRSFCLIADKYEAGTGWTSIRANMAMQLI